MIGIARDCIFLMVLVLTIGDLNAQQVKYTNASNGWNADSLGNHRAVVDYNGAGNVVRVIIEWRRSDKHPEEKKIIVQDAQTGAIIKNVKADTINREYGDLFFGPVPGRGKYYVYYLPYKNEGRSNFSVG